ncbi:MAG: hypothetical protein ACFFBD_21115 [Candidatus Hodarchaeota archaeon]
MNKDETDLEAEDMLETETEEILMLDVKDGLKGLLSLFGGSKDE